MNKRLKQLINFLWSIQGTILNYALFIWIFTTIVSLEEKLCTEPNNWFSYIYYFGGGVTAWAIYNKIKLTDD